MMHRPIISGSGMYVPTHIMTNDAIATLVDTSDAWIYERTGIRRRRVVAEGETTSSLATFAAREALQAAGVPGSAIELTIVATSMPDYGYPATACLVQDAIGAQGGAFDLEAACSGFVYGLSIAASMIQVGAIQHAMVIGSEVYSRVLNWRDRKTCILFGDGAGAAVVSRAATPGPDPVFTLGSDGSGGPLLVLPAGGIAEPAVSESTEPVGVRMNGPETFKFGVRILVDTANHVMKAADLTPNDVDWLVPHQANQRIITAATRKLGFEEGRVMSNIEEYGNTGAASIPIALAEWAACGSLRRGQRVLMVGFGAGLTWAGGLMHWQE